MSKKEEFKNLEDKLNSRYKLLNSDKFSPDEYVMMRFEQSVKWYIKKANRFKLIYFILSIMGIVFPASIPIVNGVLKCGNIPCDTLITIISVCASISASFLTLFKAQEKWVHYRHVAEMLQAEYSYYSTNVGVYMDCEKKSQLFLVRIEAIMSDEHDKWMRMFDDNSKDNHTPNKTNTYEPDNKENNDI